jgi:excisionase family DNA binding protein
MFLQIRWQRRRLPELAQLSTTIGRVSCPLRSNNQRTATEEVARPSGRLVGPAEGSERLMTLLEVSQLLGVPVATLYRWRHRGEGPTGYRIGRHVRYRRAAVEAWIEAQADQWPAW